MYDSSPPHNVPFTTMPEVVSKKLKFKGDKPKKKRRSHAPKHADELDALAAEDPSGELMRLSLS